jgi:hypothetical protein
MIEGVQAIVVPPLKPVDTIPKDRDSQKKTEWEIFHQGRSSYLSFITQNPVGRESILLSKIQLNAVKANP